MAKRSAPYLALLRGINVGGKNIIAKDELRECFENLGFQNVRTYIQSGNVLFRSEVRGIKKLTAHIETALSTTFDYSAQAVVIARNQYQAEIQSAPEDWGVDETRKHNAMFLLGSLKPDDVLTELPSPNPDYECVTTGKTTLFWSTSKQHLGKTAMMKLASSPLYKQMTVRNHKTTCKLLELLSEL